MKKVTTPAYKTLMTIGWAFMIVTIVLISGVGIYEGVAYNTTFFAILIPLAWMIPMLILTICKANGVAKPNCIGLGVCTLLFFFNIISGILILCASSGIRPSPDNYYQQGYGSQNPNSPFGSMNDNSNNQPKD